MTTTYKTTDVLINNVCHHLHGRLSITLLNNRNGNRMLCYNCPWIVCIWTPCWNWGCCCIHCCCGVTTSFNKNHRSITKIQMKIRYLKIKQHTCLLMQNYIPLYEKQRSLNNQLAMRSNKKDGLKYCLQPGPKPVTTSSVKGGTCFNLSRSHILLEG